MPAVGRSAAHVVDRARGGGHPLGKSAASSRADDETGDRSRAERAADLAARGRPRPRASRTAMTIALRGPTFMNVWGWPLG